MKSIIQTEKECFITKSTQNLEMHHIFGSANRKLSEEYGLKIWLTAENHRGNRGVHFNRAMDLGIKKIGQLAFEQDHTREEFMQKFGRNYL